MIGAGAGLIGASSLIAALAVLAATRLFGLTRDETDRLMAAVRPDLISVIAGSLLIVSGIALAVWVVRGKQRHDETVSLLRIEPKVDRCWHLFSNREPDGVFMGDTKYKAGDQFYAQFFAHFRVGSSAVTISRIEGSLFVNACACLALDEITSVNRQERSLPWRLEPFEVGTFCYTRRMRPPLQQMLPIDCEDSDLLIELDYERHSDATTQSLRFLYSCSSSGTRLPIESIRAPRGLSDQEIHNACLGGAISEDDKVQLLKLSPCVRWAAQRSETVANNCKVDAEWLGAVSSNIHGFLNDRAGP